MFLNHKCFFLNCFRSIFGNEFFKLINTFFSVFFLNFFQILFDLCSKITNSSHQMNEKWIQHILKNEYGYTSLSGLELSLRGCRFFFLIWAFFCMNQNHCLDHQLYSLALSYHQYMNHLPVFFQVLYKGFG